MPRRSCDSECVLEQPFVEKSVAGSDRFIFAAVNAARQHLRRLRQQLEKLRVQSAHGIQEWTKQNESNAVFKLLSFCFVPLLGDLAAVQSPQ